MKRIVTILIISLGLVVRASTASPRVQDASLVFRGDNFELSVYFRSIPIGAIVGVQYLPEERRFFIYATEPAVNGESILWRDEIIELTRASLEFGPQYGFSLDFERLGGRSFRAEDVADLAVIQQAFEVVDDPAIHFVRSRASGSLVAALSNAPGGRISEKAAAALRRNIADMLNAALRQDTLFSAPPPSLDPEIGRLFADPKQTRRVRRLILEDLFGPGLNRDIASRYVIQWKPLSANGVLSRIFGAGRSEAILLAGDSLLKSLATGEGAPLGVAFGPTQLALCSNEFSERIRSGSEYNGGQYVTYYDFDIRQVRAPELEGQSMWFREPTLMVRTEGATGGDSPECYSRFAASLTRRLPQLLLDAGATGQTLRNMQTLLTLNRAIGWLTGVAKPDSEFLRTIKMERIDNRPPRVAVLPIVFVAADKPVGVSISGGVRLSSGGPEQATARGPLTTEPGRPSDPGFSVTRVNVAGRRLLRIDISPIVGLGENEGSPPR